METERVAVSQSLFLKSRVSNVFLHASANRPCWPDGRADERTDRLCRRRGFESQGNGVWWVALSSPHDEDLWGFVEQERFDEQDE